MKRTLCIITAMLAVFAACRAQSRIRGSVTDGKGGALPSVVVRLYAKQGQKMSAYGLTDKNGNYDIHVNEEWLPLKLTFSHLGYKQRTVTVKDTRGRYDVAMAEEALTLKEVTVKSVPIRSRGDTLVYNVAAFRSQSDRNIEDVIRKLPGISVDNNGQISYLGESINKFYIEGLDLLSGRYALATRNISPDDIASVSVYENHQPKKVLEDIEFSEKAALNLKLKNKRMLKPTGTLTAGAGWGDDLLWKGELYGMLIGTGMQNLVTAKTNNDGTEYSAETTVLTPDGSTHAETEVWDIFQENPFGTSVVPKERYYDNESVSASANTLIKTGKDKTITVNADYRKNRNNYSNSKVTEYSSGTGEYITVTEDNASLTDTQEGNLYVRAENNGERLYLLDKLSLRARFRRNDYDLTGTDLPTQDLESNDFAVSNTLNGIIRHNDKVWQLSSDISFANTPLNRISAVLPGQSTPMMSQDAEGLKFHTKESASLQWMLGSRSDLSLDLSFEADYDKLNSLLWEEEEATANDNYGYKLVTTVSPRYQYRAGRLRFTLNVPLQMYNINYKNGISRERYTLDKPYANLRASFVYQFPHNMKLLLTAGKNHRTGGISDFVVNRIYTTYRTPTTLGTGDLSTRSTIYAMADLNYRNTINGTFATLRGNIRHTKNNTMSSSDVSEEETVTGNLNRKNKTLMWDAYAYVAKSISGTDMLLSLTGSITSMRRNVIRQSLESTVKNNVYGLELDASNRFFNDILSTNLTCKYTKSVQDLGISGAKNDMDDFTGLMKITVTPVKMLELYVSSYCNVNKQGDGQKHDNVYIDGGARFKGKTFELELTAKNLTNKKEYVVRSFIENDIYSYFYRLRPIEFLLALKLSL